MASSYSNLHPVDEILTSLVIEAVPSDDQLIADRAMETITIPERSGTLLLEETRNFMGAPELDLERAPGASRALLGGFDRTSQTFKARIYSLSERIPMEDIIDSQYPGNEEQRAARKVARAMKLAKEKRCADVLFDSSSFESSSPAAGSKFDQAGSEPLTFLHELKDTVFEAAHGINPDSLIFGRNVFRELARNPEVRGYLGTPTSNLSAGNRILNDEAVMQVLRDVLGIPNIMVGAARRETAMPGATSSEAYIWDSETIFMGILRGSDAVVQKSGNVKGQPLAAINFEFGGMVAGQYDSLDRITRTVYAEESHQFKAIDSTLGHVVTNCLNDI